MTRQELLTTAQRLVQPTVEATAEFSQKREVMAAMVNQTMSERADLAKLVGTDGKQMSEDNNRNFSLFMESIFLDYHAEVLVDTVLWVFRAYHSHGFRSIYWPANLDTWTQTMAHTLSPQTFVSITPFYTWLITHVPAFVALTDANIDNPAIPSIDQLHARK